MNLKQYTFYGSFLKLSFTHKEHMIYLNQHISRSEDVNKWYQIRCYYNSSCQSKSEEEAYDEGL